VSENLQKAQCSKHEFDAAITAGLPVFTTAHERKIHQFAEAIRAEDRATRGHDDLVGFAQFVLKGINSGHVTNASFIDNDLDCEQVEVETLSSYAEKVLAKAGAA
jgi:hypothetical protein